MARKKREVPKAKVPSFPEIVQRFPDEQIDWARDFCLLFAEIAQRRQAGSYGTR